MVDISETRWCDHGKRYDDHCPDCEVLDLSDENERLDAELVKAQNLCIERRREIERLTAENSGWQPISTAPRDGTVVDLWHKDGGRFTDEWWVEEDGEAFWTCLFDDSHFTHWKPVTEPDATASTQQEPIDANALCPGGIDKGD